MVSPKEVHNTLGKHILTDGLKIIPDLKKSFGSRIVDARDGRLYIDCFSQFASQPLGWNNPALKSNKARIDEVIEFKIANSDMYTPQYAEFVDAISSIGKDFLHYFFIDGGALGVENALKAAFDWKAEKLGIEDSSPDFKVLHLKEAFHGRTGYTLSLTNTDPIKTKYFPKFNWPRIENPKIHTYKDLEEIEQLSLKQAEKALEKGNVAAIILEPIQGEGGDNHFRKEYLQGLRKLADDFEAMLIFDEVQTGMGLTGAWWAYQHFNVVPDMMVFGKKTQVCGFCSTTRINEVENNVFNTSGRINSTWGGNLVDMVRATIIIEIIKAKELVENANKVGKYLMDKLKNLELKNLRGRGLMIAFDHPERDAFYNKLMNKMLCLKSGQNSIRLRPALTFSPVDADYVFKIIKDAL